MAEYIIKKEKDYTIKGVRKNVISKKGYIIPTELPNSTVVPALKRSDINNGDYSIIKGNVYNMLKIIASNENGNKIINDIYKNLKYVNSKEDIIKIIKDCIRRTRSIIDKNAIFNNNLNTLINEVKTNGDLVISIFVKKALGLYFLNLISDKDALFVSRLYDLKIDGANVNDVLDLVNISFEDKVNKNESITPCNEDIKALSIRVLYDAIDVVYDNLHPHLCWMSCENARANKCEKVKDIDKKKIDEYEFITDGYQLCDEKENVRKFVVTGCKNYKEEKIDKANMLELRKKLADLYDLKELYEDEVELKKQYRYRGSTISSRRNWVNSL